MVEHYYVVNALYQKEKTQSQPWPQRPDNAANAEWLGQVNAQVSPHWFLSHFCGCFSPIPVAGGIGMQVTDT